METNLVVRQLCLLQRGSGHSQSREVEGGPVLSLQAQELAPTGGAVTAHPRSGEST